jgi:hypothetical protein
MIPEPQNSANDPPESAGEQEDATASFLLDSVREEIAASSADARRNARRIFDALKQVGGVLDAMSVTLESVHRSVRDRDSAATVQAEGDQIESMGLVELADRVDRIRSAIERRPEARSWWPGAQRHVAPWREDRERLAEAFFILASHIDGMLKRAGLQRMQVVGAPFDPSCMTAVEATVDDSVPDHTVLEEIVPGWIHGASNQTVRPSCPCAKNTLRNPAI